MPVEPLRVVTDRWEWASLAQLAPSVYHSQSWTVAAARRLAEHSRGVCYGYARLNTPTGIVALPIIRVHGQWSNVPRTRPLQLTGSDPDPVATFMAAVPTDVFPTHLRRLVLHDDSAQTAKIAKAGNRLEHRAATIRRYREMDRRVVGQLTRVVEWADDAEAAAWIAALRASWTFVGWSVELRAYLDSYDEPIGWAVWCSRGGDAECIAAAVGTRAHAWSTAR